MIFDQPCQLGGRCLSLTDRPKSVLGYRAMEYFCDVFIFDIDILLWATCMEMLEIVLSQNSLFFCPSVDISIPLRKVPIPI